MSSDGPSTAVDLTGAHRFLGGLINYVGNPVALDFGQCVQCGTCTASCPSAHAMDISPRRIVRLASLGLWREILSGRSVWQCLSCGSCQIRCPRGIGIHDGMLALRREFGNQLGLPGAMTSLVAMVSKAKNVAGDRNENRNLWWEDADVKPVVVGGTGCGSPPDVLYFVGCVASLFPAVNRIPASVAGVLSLAGLRIGIMGGDEWCCGFPLIGAGETAHHDGPLLQLVKHNVAAALRSGVHRVVCSCPSCYHTWKHAYPKILARPLGFDVLHVSELFLELIDGGRLELRPQEVIATYHDPCDLGRKSAIIQEPRSVLRAVPGLELREMRFSGADAKCCGGGGNLEMNDAGLSGEIATNRLSEAIGTGARVLVSSCQQCKRSLQGAARRQKTGIKVLDVSEVLLRSASGERR